MKFLARKKQPKIATTDRLGKVLRQSRLSSFSFFFFVFFWNANSNKNSLASSSKMSTLWIGSDNVQSTPTGQAAM